MRHAIVGLLLLAAGCGGSRTSSRRAQPVAPDVVLTAPMPDEIQRLDVPIVRAPLFRLVQLTSAPTWPLTDPPSLEPHQRVASPWYRACERRGHLHDDTLAYVEAWCSYRRDPRFDLVRALLRLRSSSAANIADAARRDLANLVADARDGQGAVAWLATDASGDEALTELVIAVYTDLGQIADATVVADEYRAKRSVSSRCGHELVALRFGFDFRSEIDTERLFVRARIYGGTPCGVAMHRAACAVEQGAVVIAGFLQPRFECDGVLDEDELVGARAVGARFKFQGQPDPQTLLDIADLASSALHVYDAEELALAALEGVLAMSCKNIGFVQDTAARIRRSDHAQARHDARRDALIAMTPDRCAKAKK